MAAPLHGWACSICFRARCLFSAPFLFPDGKWKSGKSGGKLEKRAVQGMRDRLKGTVTTCCGWKLKTRFGLCAGVETVSWRRCEACSHANICCWGLVFNTPQICPKPQKQTTPTAVLAATAPDFLNYGSSAGICSPTTRPTPNKWRSRRGKSLKASRTIFWSSLVKLSGSHLPKTMRTL